MRTFALCFLRYRLFSVACGYCLIKPKWKERIIMQLYEENLIYKGNQAFPVLCLLFSLSLARFIVFLSLGTWVRLREKNSTVLDSPSLHHYRMCHEEDTSIQICGIVSPWKEWRFWLAKSEYSIEHFNPRSVFCREKTRGVGHNWTQKPRTVSIMTVIKGFLDIAWHGLDSL